MERITIVSRLKAESSQRLKKKALIAEGLFQRGKEEGTVQGRRSKALYCTAEDRQK
jgi:hypothetical protein